MTFTSTRVTPDTLAGDLTINGITRPVELDLEVYGVTVDGYGVTRAGFGATGSITRSEFDISFNMPVGLDGMLISDKVTIELEIQATAPEG
jgi:polyisoprenoid-binding protein YceI